MVNIIQLATAEEVQKALNLSSEQKDKVASINENFRDQQREIFRQGGDPRETQEERQKLTQESQAELAKALDETQNKRLQGILANSTSMRGINNSDIAKELEITDEQKESLGEIRRDGRDELMEKLQDLRDQNLSREDESAKRAEIYAEWGKKLLAALTTDQQSKYEALKGEPVKIDMAQFRMGRGGRGGGGGRGGDAGGRGDGGGRGADVTAVVEVTAAVPAARPRAIAGRSPRGDVKR